jgi:DinB superfamily
LLNDTVGSGFAARYEELGAKIQELTQPLSEEQFWTKPFSFGNSFGHLVLHLTGNLNYYIGAGIAATGYVRDRDREFSETARPPKQDVMKRFAEAVAMVARTARAQSEADWAQKYTAVREEDAENRFNIFLRCATHLHLHVGQMIYLQFELKKSRL